MESRQRRSCGGEAAVVNEVGSFVHGGGKSVAGGKYMEVGKRNDMAGMLVL